MKPGENGNEPGHSFNPSMHASHRSMCTSAFAAATLNQKTKTYWRFVPALFPEKNGNRYCRRHKLALHTSHQKG